MKKGLLGTSALIGATALMAGAAGAAEAPTWKLTGNLNFQAYFADRDNVNDAAVTTTGTVTIKTIGGLSTTYKTGFEIDRQSAKDFYFGVDESELQLNVSGTADNGLNYGFKIEINANTTDGTVADEARLQLSGGWGTLQMGDEDGAEDIMNYGGENLMGATGGFDGDGDDVAKAIATYIFPTIAGDSSDATKVSYFSPRFSGFQVGASYSPTGSDGDRSRESGHGYQNIIGLGGNYDNSFGDLRIRASAVYAGASYEGTNADVEDISAYSVGGIVGWGPVSVAANWTDNAESGTLTSDDQEHSYWNVAASFETGPMYFSAGYIAHTYSTGVNDWEPSAIALTADYTVAPGLGVYAEWTGYDSDDGAVTAPGKRDASVFIAGANVSF